MNEDLIIELRKISEQGIVSYEYIHKIIEMININGSEYRNGLSEILSNYKNNSSTDLSVDIAFTAYYSLCFYYKRYDKVKDLKKTINMYQDLFNDQVLSNEIQSWYYRRIGDLEKSVELDRKMISEISVEENAGPYISFASSISKLLEKEFTEDINNQNYKYWENPIQKNKDWKKALNSIDEAIKQYHLIRPNKNYGKHYFIYGKLLMFTPDISQKPSNDINITLDSAEKYFSLAIQYENENEEDYYRRYEEYRTYQTKCGIIRMQLISLKNNTMIQQKLEELEQAKEDIKKSMESQQAKEIELLSIFSAIISIILGGINIAGQMSLAKGMFLLCTLAFIFISLICLAVSLNREKKLVPTIISILSILIVLSSLVFIAIMLSLGFME